MSELEQSIKAIKKVKSINVFIKFLEAFKAEEEQHIRTALNPEDPKDFNIRAAALCTEAYAAADLMQRMITEDT
jgi:hypothetical protein